MTQYLPPNLLSLFAARDPIPYLPPVDKLTWEKKTDGYSGVAQLISRFEDPANTPAPKHVETRDERMERKRREKAEQIQYKLEQEIAMWDPHNDPSATTDPYKTLFVARINYDTSESKLRREFEIYGPIKKIRMVVSTSNNKPRGYAFIEYEHERDMHSAYKNADGRKIDNRRVLVDVERARTVKGWLSRRLGGGLGGTRRGGPDVNIKHSGREDDRKKAGHDDLERDEGRSRDRSRERDRRRTRSPRTSRDRDRRRRSRSKERKRRRSRDRVAEVTVDEDETRAARRHRSRSRERERKHRRSRSRERKHRRDRERERAPKIAGGEGALPDGEMPPKIKQEPDDDYPDYSNSNTVYNNIPLKDEDGRPKNGTKFEEDEDVDCQETGQDILMTEFQPHNEHNCQVEVHFLKNFTVGDEHARVNSTMDDDIVETISVFQRKLDKYSDVGDSSKLLYYLSKLKHLPIKVLHLEKTGVGITVNRLRHAKCGVGDRARNLVALWKKMVAADVGEENAVDASRRSSSSDSASTTRDPQTCQMVAEDDDEDETRLQIEVAEDASGDEPGDCPVLPDVERKSEAADLTHDEEVSELDCTTALGNDYDPSLPLTLPSHSNGDSRMYSKYSEVTLSDSDHGPAKYNPLTSTQDYGEVGTSSVPIYEPTPTASSAEAVDSHRENASASTSSHSQKKSKHKHSRSKDKKHKSHSKDKSSKSKHKSKSSDVVKEKTHKDKRKEDERSSCKRSREDTSDVGHSEQSLDRRRAKIHKASVQDDSHSLVQSSNVSLHNSSPECDIVYNGHSSLPDAKSVKDNVQEATSSSKHKSHGRHSSSHSSKNHNKKVDKKSSKDHHPEVGSTSAKRKKLECDEGFGAALLSIDSPDVSSKKKKSKSSHKEKDEKRDKNHKSKSSHKDKKRSSSSSSKPEHRAEEPPPSSPVAASSASVSIPPAEAVAAAPAPAPALLAPINPNYKPLPHLALPDIDNDIDVYPIFDQPTMNRYSDEDLALEVMTSKKSRRQIYSGRSKLSEVPSLFDIATRCLQENIDSLEYTGGVPFEVIKPVIEKASAKQLFNLEHHNAYLLDSTSHIWEQHCKRDFKNCKPKDMETFRDMHIRLMDERREKLKNVQRRVALKREEEMANRCQAKLAFKGVVPKPPPSVSRAQAKFGTGAAVGAPTSKSKADEVKARKAAMSNVQRAERSGVGPNARPAANKKPKAPLMAKTMQFYKKTFRR
ncbi:Transcription factor IIS N-terminal [Trinorchestia longiramus]|nr:Transcription factor IIS N-terminal [Trinorchestia longiramus]